ncbi:MAG: ketoacyl-ACP synthase III [Puniceicoccales bacterium]|jgi:3-oxoacyl-[acyl-carrier-protein] synthase-3|nr:ketoacyl-ACP synthase III [Puniceicoccales bacterium]
MKQTKEIYILGIGSYLPRRILTNAYFESRMDTTDEWIVSRTGIRERHIADDDEYTSDMATEAAKIALEDAKMSAQEIDCILVCSVTFDMAFPATACIVQKKLGHSASCPCMDIEAGCSGLIYSFEVAAGLLQLGHYKNILVIASDKLTSITDWNDRATCVLFGDGSSAFVLSTEKNGAKALLVDTLLSAEGKDAEHLLQPAGGSAMPASHETVDKRLHFLHMNGREVFKCAVRGMIAVLEKILQRNQIQPSAIRYFIPHQANLRIIESIADSVSMAMDRFIVVLQNTGNTSAGSSGIALDHAYRGGKLAKDDLLAFVTFGGGMTCASAIIRWIA